MADSNNESNNQFRIDPGNFAIALLVIIVLIMGFILAKNTFFRSAPELAHYDEKGEKVSVFEVRFDRKNQKYIDLVFDEPIGKEEKGEVLGRDPATISPALNGSWSWISPSVLRFYASDRFRMATDYTISLIPERLLKNGQILKGKSEFEVRTDKFKIEQSTVEEEPVVDKKNTVTLQGTLRFNYSVDPKILARKISLLELSDSEDGEGQSIPIKLKTNYWNRSIKWISGPVEKKKQERVVELKVLGDLTPAEGNVALGEEDYSQIIPIGSKDNLSVRNVVSKALFPRSSIKIKFSSAINPEIAADYISIKPGAKYSIQRIQNTLVLKGGFKPGSSYDLTIQKGLPAVDDAVLQERVTKKVRFSNLKPSIEFESPGMFLNSKGSQAVKIKSVNVKEVDLTVNRVYLNNLFFLFQSYGYSVWRDEYYQGTIGNYFGNRIIKDKLTIAGKLNQQTDTVLDLKKYIPSNESGLYQVGIVPNGAYQGVQKWVLITDIGIVAKWGDDEILVWTSAFSNLEPVSGAAVRIISKQNQLIAKGITDTEGMLRIKGLKQKLSDHKPYMVTVKKGGDYSFLLLDTMEISTSGLDVGGAVAPDKGYTAYAYGERDIYRPGETVEGVSIVRDSSLTAPAPMPVILMHIDPKGRVVKTIKENMSDKGLVPFEFVLPDYSPTGNHTIEFLVGKSTIGRYKFQVEEFIPDRIKVKIDPEKNNISVGGELSYDVQSSYLFGPPSSNLPVETRIDLVERPFLPDGYKGFVFTNEDRKFKSREIFVKKTTLDKDGQASFSVELPEGLTPPSSLQAQITARVQETGGRGVTSHRKINVDPYPYYLGLKRKNADQYAEPTQDAEFEYVALTVKGDDTVEADTGALKAELYKDSWNTVLRKTPSGNYKYESVRDSTLIDSKIIDIGGAKGGFTFTPQEFGSYRVILSDSKGGASTQIQFYASGWGFSPWALENPARIELDLEKSEYMPGEVANVQIRAPFGGKLLLTVERGNIYYTKILNMDGNTAIIPVPVSNKYRPNAYITATIIRSVKDIESGSAGRAFGAIPINVDKTENEMNVEIEAPEEIRPDSVLEVTVKTVPNSSITVAAVDEGILQLIAQKTADPFDFFYSKLALVVNSYDTFSLLLPDVALGASPAGGGYAAKRELQFLSTQGIRRVKPVALWSGIVEADESGIARIKFDVPGFQGALRVMAVSIDGKRFGSSEAFVKVKSPVVILPTVPRFLSLHEKVVIPVSIRNDTGQDGQAQVRMNVDGSAKVTVQSNGGESSDDALITVKIPNNSEKTVYFNINTFDYTGATKITVEATVNNESSGIVIDVPILPDLPKSTQDDVGRVTSNNVNIAIENVNDFRSKTLEREVHISKLPLIQFSGKLEYLITYPYGCLEQVTSKVFPLIYLSNIAKELDPKLFRDSDPEALVQEGIRRVGSMQRSGGGFSLWPGGGPVQPWASIYASHFLLEAKRAGFFIEQSVYSSALSFLNSEAKAKSSYGTGELERAVYALYVLSRDSQADLSTMDFIRERHFNELTVESKAFLSGAYAAQGDSSALEEILKGINDVEQIERQTGDNFNSTIRNRAILLLAILDINPDDPRIPTLVDRLSRDAKVNRWWTTQESAFALLALGQFIKKQAASKPFSGTVYLGDKQLGVFTSDATFSVTGLSGTDPILIKMDEGYQEGSAFYSVITRGYPTLKGFKPVQSGLNVERAFLDRSGASVDLKSLEQGDLIVVRTKIQSESGRVDNVVIENLLPSGFEVENPRLKTTETLKWATGNKVKLGYLDIRDDRILIFTDLPDNKWYNYYALLRVINPGTFTLPPIQAEAMYSPNIRYTGKLEDPINVNIRK